MTTPLPELNIPPSSATVNVSIINTGGWVGGIPARRFVEPHLKGMDYLSVPVYSFYIHHPVLNRSLVFDLGIKQDWENFPPQMVEGFRKGGFTLEAPTNVRQILDDGGVDTRAIEAIVWSHWHFDHTGNPSTFEPHTKLIVGPGSKEHIFPGWPDNPKAAFLQRDVAGRDIHELDFTRGGLRLGRFPALDYFGDGSFYLLDSPGHAIGHVCGLARVTTSPDTFIVMGGDAFHQAGELRPHEWAPLPVEEGITPNPFDGSDTVCPGELFESILRGGPAKPFYVPTGAGSAGEKGGKKEDKESVHHDAREAAETIGKLQEYDAHDNVLVAVAHDASLLHVVDFFPKPANDFARQGWVRKVRWAFLQDFAEAVGYEGEVVGKADHSHRP